jgi:hypothetical protein
LKCLTILWLIYKTFRLDGAFAFLFRFFDLINFLLSRRWAGFFIFYSAYMSLFIYFVVTQYAYGTQKSFVSIDKYAGVCVDEKSSTTCCEVPTSVTGSFLVDKSGNWNSQSDFSYILANYGVTMTAVQYTNATWTDIMTNLASQMQVIGKQGANRDYAW